MDYKKLKTPDLRALCEKHDLSIDGKKDVLIKRLTDYSRTQGDQLSFDRNTTESKQSKVSDVLLLQLKLSNIARYLNAGVIYPLSLEESEIYKSENRKKDIFSEFEDYLVLSDGVVNEFSDDDVVIEIITTNLLTVSIKGTVLSYISEPVPISRINSIFFKNEISRKSFISSIKTFPDSFVNESRCLILPSTIKTYNINLSEVSLPLNGSLSDWKGKLQTYDRLLGMFSFMKNSGVFFAERENLYQEYTHNYFYALGLINSNIKPNLIKDVGLYRYILFPQQIEESNIQRVLFKFILECIYNNDVIDIPKAIQLIERALSDRRVTPEESRDLRSFLELFRKLSFHNASYKDVLNDEAIRKNYPIVALLYLAQFPNKGRQHTDKQAVRNTFIFHENQLNRNLSEFLLAVLGLYYGYKSMIKEDTNLKILDAGFASLAEHQQSIKFKVMSRLDKVTIESIFNFSKTSRPTSEKFDFLVREPVKGIFVPPKWGAFEYYDSSYEVLDTKVSIVERRNKSERVFELMDKYYPENINSKSFLSHYIISNYGLTKKILIEILKNNSNKLNIDEIGHVIDLDQRQKNR